MVYSTLLNDNTDFVSFDFLKREDLEQIAIKPYESYPNVTVLEISNISTGGANILEIIFDNVEGISGDYYTGYYLGEYWEFQDDILYIFEDSNGNSKIDKNDDLLVETNLGNNYYDFDLIQDEGGSSSVYRIQENYFLNLTVYNSSSERTAIFSTEDSYLIYDVIHTKSSILNDSGNNKFIGTNLNDWIEGSNSNDLILGGLGNDVLLGNLGNDVIRGGSSKDIIYGGLGKDKINGGDGQDRILGAKGKDKLFGEEGNDFLSGGEGHDVIEAGVGNDILNGGLGNDLLVGGKGKDELIGGEGKDIFKLSKGIGYDLIQDFQDKQDKIFIGSMKKLKLKNKGNDVYIYKGKDLLANVKGAKGVLSKKRKYLV